MTKHIVQPGDSLREISQRYLGTPTKAEYIFNFNNGCKSGKIDLIYPGEVILIPYSLTDEEIKITPPKEIKKGEVVITVDGLSFYGWTSAEIVKNMDTPADGFSMTINYDGTTPPEVFKPFTYPKCIISIDGEILLTGRVEHVKPSISNSQMSISIQGRSLPGWLLDIPITKRPAEFENKTIEDIAKEIVNINGVVVKFESDPGEPFEKVTPQHGESIQSFLNKLAIERGLICTSSAKGELIFKRAEVSPSVALFEEGKNIFSASATYDGTNRFSEIIADATQVEGPANHAKAEDTELKNNGINRPKIITANSNPDENGLLNIAKWEMNKHIADSISLNVENLNWQNPTTNKIWSEGDTVEIIAPSLYLDQPTEMIIKSVKLGIDTSGKKATLSLILPIAYTLGEK